MATTSQIVSINPPPKKSMPPSSQTRPETLTVPWSVRRPPRRRGGHFH
jgi:hypothetical protein